MGVMRNNLLSTFVASCLLLAGARCLAQPASFAWRLTVEEPDGRVAEVASAAPRADIEVMLETVETADGWTVTGRVVNKGKGRVTAFEGPVFEGLAVDKARSGFYVPDGFGRRVSSFAAAEGPKRPVGWKRVGDGEYMYETANYPGRQLAMPWVALDDGKSGATVSVLDPVARTKHFTLCYRPAQDAAAIAPVHPIFLDPGQTWMLPTVSFARYAGDWHVAARKYRAWYDSVRKVGDFPAWTKRMNGWLLVILKQQNEEIFWPYGDFDKLADYADKLGLDMIGLFGWTVGGHDHLYPDYDPCPKMGGREALVKGIKLLQKRGKRVCIYANGQLQQVGATAFWEQYGKNIALVKKDGKLVIQNYHKYSDIPRYDFALGCLHATPWHERMRFLARQANDLGADALLYDQLGIFSPFACYGKGHGHPTPAWSYEAERPAFIRSIADEMKKLNPDFVIMTEGLHDSIFDSVAYFHGCSFGTYHPACNSLVRARLGEANPGGEWPETIKYTFPELASTVRVPTPIVDRIMLNYTLAFGFRHDVELRYGPDRVYVETGKVTSNYGAVKNPPSLKLLASAPQEKLAAYMKAVSAFQHKSADLLLEGRFVDTDGFTFTGSGCLAKRFTGAKGSGVLVWNMGKKPAIVTIAGLGEPAAVTEPEAGTVAAAAPLAADTLRLYRFAK